MSIAQAVKNLRAEFGESQQAFATRLGLSVRAIANYEGGGRKPITEVLGRLHAAALSSSRPQLSRIFFELVQEDITANLARCGFSDTADDIGEHLP